uniref:protein scribble homolog n=1 Tax=Oncorhynchus gorbuscha TaxID=8017 RepID=UPI001EAF6B1D
SLGQLDQCHWASWIGVIGPAGSVSLGQLDQCHWASWISVIGPAGSVSSGQLDQCHWASWISVIGPAGSVSLGQMDQCHRSSWISVIGPDGSVSLGQLDQCHWASWISVIGPDASVSWGQLDQCHWTSWISVMGRGSEKVLVPSVFFIDEKSPRHCSSGNMEDGDKLLAPPPSFGSHFERTITVVRGNRSLGLTVSAMKDGSGMLIRSVVRGGSVCQDGRLGVGDTILAVNGEPSTNLTNAVCRAMLRRHSVTGSDMSVTFIPSFLVEEHRASMAQQPLSSIMVDGPSPCPLTPSPTPPGGLTPSPTPPGGLTPSPTPPGGPTLFPTPHGAPDTASTVPTPGPATAPRPQGPSLPRPVVSVTSTAPASTPTKGPPRPPPPDKSPIPKPPPSPVPMKERSGLDGVREEEKNVERKREEEEEEVREEEEREDEMLVYPTNLSWAQPRRVKLMRSSGQSLGISIMGGRGMGSRLSSGEVMRGVFIKHITPDSPAGHNGTLKTGDRILEVGGMDLRDASHEQAVEAIRSAGDPVVFLVQTGQHTSQSSPVLSNHERQASASHRGSPNNRMPESHSGLFLRLSPANPFTPTPFKVSDSQ